MKRRTIIGIILAAGLLLIGTAAYAHWSDYGPGCNYGREYGYGCRYGYRTAYNTDAKDRAVKNFGPCYGHRYSGRNWRADCGRRSCGNGWIGYRGYRTMGPRGRW